MNYTVGTIRVIIVDFFRLIVVFSRRPAVMVPRCVLYVTLGSTRRVAWGVTALLVLVPPVDCRVLDYRVAPASATLERQSRAS